MGTISDIGNTDASIVAILVLRPKLWNLEPTISPFSQGSQGAGRTISVGLRVRYGLFLFRLVFVLFEPVYDDIADKVR